MFTGSSQMRTISLIASLLVFGAASAVDAQSYPNGPVRIIAPSPPGSPRDIRARWVADRLASALGQPIIVENKAGAGGNIGMEAAAKSPPDGQTLVIVDLGTMAQNPHLYARTGYDPLADFIPVTRLVNGPLMMAVHPDVPARSVGELIGLARAKPGSLSYGSSGIGTPPHLAGELFKRMAGIDVVHVPYKGAAPALADLLGGRIAYTIDSLAMDMPAVRTGKLRALAVTGSSRAEIAPDVPTLREAGLGGYEYSSWMGIAVPAGTPRSIVDRLNTELVRALRQPEAKAWFREQGGEVIGDDPEDFARVVRADYVRWRVIIHEAGIAAE
jgi:tripartite-type tricarboxylate transporter receptor subunit TctC